MSNLYIMIGIPGSGKSTASQQILDKEPNTKVVSSDSLREDPVFYDALLNRANALLMAGKLVSAKEDYIDFVEKRPDACIDRIA